MYLFAKAKEEIGLDVAIEYQGKVLAGNSLVVSGQEYTRYDNELTQIEQQMRMQQEQAVFNNLANKNRAQIISLRKNRDQAGLQALQERLITETKEICNENGCVAKFRWMRLKMF